MKRPSIAVMAALLALGLAACSSGGKEAGSSTNSPPTSSLSGSETGAPTTVRSTVGSPIITGPASSSPAKVSETGSPAMTASDAKVSEPASSPAAPAASAMLTEQDGKLVDTDKEAKVIEGAGLAITVDPAAKTVTFQQIDPASGEKFQNFTTFDYTKGTMLRHLVSSAMGKTYEYTLELATNTLASVADDKGKDLSESTRQAGRWEKAEGETRAQRADFEAYFLARYGKSIEQVASGS